jgi:glucosylceramidase
MLRLMWIVFSTAIYCYSQQITWICTTDGKPWSKNEKVVLQPFDNTRHCLVEINPDVAFQKIDGFGGCFNEKGWDALAYLAIEEREAVLRQLFDPDESNFTICRMPIGSNDYAMDYYSLNDVADDFTMKYFSIERDKKYLIPYIKAAMHIQPGLKMWGSPWCPPSWMKRNKHYFCPGMESDARMIWEPQVLSAYALYFAKYVQAYRNEGIDIVAVHVQNEPYACQIFPSCLWTGAELRDFIRDYLSPCFSKEKLTTEIWLGTINHGDVRAYAGIVFADAQVRQAVTGVGYQWDGKHAIDETHRLFPEKKLWQTESECGDGANDQNAGLYTYTLLKKYFEGGANGYFYWNMVLDESGMSTWGWRQNSLISIDRRTQIPRYNFEFYVMKHFSHFIQPGAMRIRTTGEDESALAFKNPDGNIIITYMNPGFTDREVTIRVGEKMIKIIFPNGSVNTIVLTPS